MSGFAKKIVAWRKVSGRHGLPWQATRDPYRIWLSEIMLQQTQVSTAIPYYERFLRRFPDVASLAAADTDEVMRYWAGLGYYARARNLHKASQVIVSRYGGDFPDTPEAWLELPGIGRSTAAAIVAFAFSKRHAILDGNVKRVFARHFAIDGDIKTRAVEASMWAMAESLLPLSDVGGYTQGLMDLGATVCTRTNPACGACPVRASCLALAQGRVDVLPRRAPARAVPHRETRLLVLVGDGELLLERRPTAGIWGGLLCMPEARATDDLVELVQRRFGLEILATRQLVRVEHAFTHFSLSIEPVELSVHRINHMAMEPGLVWLSPGGALDAAIPAPVKRILLEREALSR